jgi:hypothetical protein
MTPGSSQLHVNQIRLATQAIHKVLEERGYSGGYVFWNDIARDMYGDGTIPRVRFSLSFLLFGATILTIMNFIEDRHLVSVTNAHTVPQAAHPNV